MTARGVFYPDAADTAEERLGFYASRFPIVEVDATYYALPSRRTAELWVERTPPDFTFDIKAHALMTGQPTETKRLPKELRAALPDALAEKSRLYAKDLPDDLRDEVWRWFAEALEPLREAGQLGSILLQYPRWFFTSSENRDTIEDGDRPAARGRPDGRGRVPERIVVQREEHRADAALPRRPEHPARDRRWSAGLQVERAADRRRAVTGPRDPPVPRPPDRHLGGEGRPDGRALPVSLRRGRARRLDAACPRDREPVEGHARPVQQLLRELRGDERRRAGKAPRGPRVDGRCRARERCCRGRYRPRAA